MLLHLVQRSSSSPPRTQFLLCLRLLASVVVVTEECENTDNQTHHHKQRQGKPEYSPALVDLGKKTTHEKQDLLHPPVKTVTSYSKDPLAHCSQQLYTFIHMQWQEFVPIDPSTVHPTHWTFTFKLQFEVFSFCLMFYSLIIKRKLCVLLSTINFWYHCQCLYKRRKKEYLKLIVDIIMNFHLPTGHKLCCKQT